MYLPYYRTNSAKSQKFIIMTVIIFILVLSFLVVAHEFGHFIVARKSGMKVYEFGVGFPPRAFGFYRHPKTGKFHFVIGRGKSSLEDTVGGKGRQEEFPATLYSFNWLPLGGFVKIKGENGEDADESDSFGYQKTWQKLLTLVAGVVMNFLVAALLLGVGFMIGLPVDLSDGVPAGAIQIEDSKVIIQSVVSGTPAELAGLMMGDTIHSLNGERMLGTSYFIEKTSLLIDQDITLEVERATEKLVFTLKPEILKGDFGADGKARLGILLVDAGVIRYPWYIAMWKGLVAATFGFISIFVGLYILIKTMIFGGGMVFDVAGPVGIAKLVGDSAKMGVNYLLQITAMISLSLAAINILPIPALDGGRVLFVLIEKFTGRKVPLKYEQLAHTIGFLVLMILIIVITFRDVKKLF